ncbi:hypothetical protein DSECCO2_663850 [anaerobic digester metagenome]
MVENNTLTSVIFSYNLIYPLVYLTAGAILTFAVNEIRDRRKEKRESEYQINSITTLINTELNYNIKLLHEFGHEMEKSEKLKDDNSPTAHGTFLNYNLPTFETIIWEKQSYLITKAFTDKKIERLQIFYGSLNQLTSSQSRLRFLRTNLPNNFYNNYAKQEWIKSKAILKQLKEKGNPLDPNKKIDIFLGFDIN